MERTPQSDDRVSDQLSFLNTLRFTGPPTFCLNRDGIEGEKDVRVVETHTRGFADLVAPPDRLEAQLGALDPRPRGHNHRD